MTGMETLKPQCAIQKFNQDEFLTTLAKSFKQSLLGLRHNVVNTQKRLLKKTPAYQQVLKKIKSTDPTECVKTRVKTDDITPPALSLSPHESFVRLNKIKKSSHSSNVNVKACTNFSLTSSYTKFSSLSTLHISSCMEKKKFQKKLKENETLNEWPLKNALHPLLPPTLRTENINTLQKTNVCLNGNISKKFISNATKSATIPLYETLSTSHLSPSRSHDGKQNDMRDCFETAKAPIRKRNPIQSLYRAILSSSVDQVKHCLEQGGDPNAKIFFNATESQVFVGYIPPIFIAAFFGHKEILQLLLNEGGCVNAVNFKNQNSLHFLFNQSPSHALSSTVLSASYPLMQKNYVEFDAFMKTNQKNFPNTYENIISTNSNLNTLNYLPLFTKSSALPNLQTQQDKFFDCVYILLKHGINIHAKDNKGWIPLDYATQIYGLTNTHPLVKILSE